MRRKHFHRPITATVTITRQALTQPTLPIVSGNGQSGVIRSPLAAPLVAQLVNGTGLPMVGAQVFSRSSARTACLRQRAEQAPEALRSS